MKIEKIMTKAVGCCVSEDTLTKVAKIMRQKNCGGVPIIDGENQVIGIITDRDVCLAALSQNKKISQIKAAELIGAKIISCAASDKIEDALKKMRKNQIKRLPVIGKNGELVGILSVSDVLMSARKNKKLQKKIYSTLRDIFQPRPIVLNQISE